MGRILPLASSNIKVLSSNAQNKFQTTLHTACHNELQLLQISNMNFFKP